MFKLMEKKICTILRLKLCLPRHILTTCILYLSELPMPARDPASLCDPVEPSKEATSDTVSPCGHIDHSQETSSDTESLQHAKETNVKLSMEATCDIMSVDKSNIAETLLNNINTMASYNEMGDPKTDCMDSEDKENIKENVNVSPGETTTKVLSKALHTLVREDIDTVTPPRKVKVKTPVKKKLNLFRPYELEDRKKPSMPMQSPMLLRANYHSKGQTDAWHIEKRSKSEAISPQFCGIESSQNHSKLKSVSDKPTDIRTYKLNNSEVPLDERNVRKEEDTVKKSTCNGMEQNTTLSLNIHVEGQLQKSVSSKPTSVSSCLPQVNKTMAKTSVASCVKDVDCMRTNTEALEMKEQCSQLISQRMSQIGGNGKVFQVPSNISSMTSAKPLLPVSDVMGRSIKERAPLNAAEQCLRPTITDRTGNVSLELEPSLKRPDSCPPRMSNADAIVNITRKGIYSSESEEHVEPVEKTYHMPSSDSIPLMSNSGKTQLPSIATFSNKPLLPKPPGSLNSEILQKETQTRVPIPPFPSFLSSAMVAPKRERVDEHHPLIRHHKTVPNLASLGYQGSFIALKRSHPRSYSEPHTKQLKVTNEVSVKDSDNSEYSELNREVMRIPLREPIPSPKTNTLKLDLHSSHNMFSAGRSMLPVSVFSSHLNSSGTATASRYSDVNQSSQRQYSGLCADRERNIQSENTVEKVKKKLDMDTLCDEEIGAKKTISESKQKLFCFTPKSAELSSSYVARHAEGSRAVRNLVQDSLSNNCQDSKAELPKYTFSKSQGIPNRESLISRYDTENNRQPTVDTKVKFEKPYCILPHPVNISRRPLGVSMLQNQMSTPQRISSREITSDSKPFSVLKTPDSAYLDRQKHVSGDSIHPAIRSSFMQQPFPSPMRPVRPASAGLPSFGHPQQTSAVYGSSVVGSRPALSPLPLGPPVADKLPMAALLLMMKVRGEPVHESLVLIAYVLNIFNPFKTNGISTPINWTSPFPF